MIVTRLELVDFRNYVSATFTLAPGVTAVVGLNGQGKTNFAEAVAYLATLDSFRGAPDDALVRIGANSAVVRAVIAAGDGRDITVEAEINRNGRNRVLVNRQRLGRARDLLGVVRATVFSPDDLELIKAGPGLRRRFLDDTLVSLAIKYDAMRLDLDRVLKQRNTLLKNANGRLDGDAAFTLDVWDARLGDLGDQFGRARAVLVDRLHPMVIEAYVQLAGAATPIEVSYRPTWRETGLAAALTAARGDDVRRGVSTVGPHRDDLDLVINSMAARTHASQGEQRTLALALRLAAHRLVTEHTGSAPLLILDDVLSELDHDRATALLRHLPSGQVVLTSAASLPSEAHPDAVVRIAAGTVSGVEEQ